MALALNKNVRVTKRISAKPVPKAKTPQDALWSWLLARATTRRLKLVKRLVMLYDKTTQYPAGFLLVSIAGCHTDERNVPRFLKPCNRVPGLLT
jgi:hypothetical protein